MWGAALTCIWLGACAAHTQGPPLDDQQYLTFGVDPKLEAKALIRDLEDQGLTASPMLYGDHFYAVGVQHEDRSSLGVRVVTRRGIALALDRVRPTVFQQGVVYRLLPPPWPDTHDADGDGSEEVFIEVQRGQGSTLRRCISAYRVRDTGVVDAIDGKKLDFGNPPPSREIAWHSPVFCDLPAGGAEEPSPAPGSPEPTSADMTAPSR